MDLYYLRIPQRGPAGSSTLAAALNGGPAHLSAVGPIPGAIAGTQLCVNTLQSARTPSVAISSSRSLPRAISTSCRRP